MRPLRCGLSDDRRWVEWVREALRRLELRDQRRSGRRHKEVSRPPSVGDVPAAAMRPEKNETAEVFEDMILEKTACVNPALETDCRRAVGRDLAEPRMLPLFRNCIDGREYYLQEGGMAMHGRSIAAMAAALLLAIPAGQAGARERTGTSHDALPQEAVLAQEGVLRQSRHLRQRIRLFECLRELKERKRSDGRSEAYGTSASYRPSTWSNPAGKGKR